MWTYEKADHQAAEIFWEMTGIDFQSETGLRDAKLFGGRVKMNARELLAALFKIEEAFQIQVPANVITSGTFDTYNHILEHLLQLVK
ncbi:MAG: hypothetical protein Q4F83_10030 [Eubacteriales bacterium]|nr:hypothetical protein [Eubacteriales bacterium]